MLQEFEGLRNDIRLVMIKDQDYSRSIELLNQYSQLLKRFFEDNSFDWWFVNYNTALAYKKLGDIKNAIKYVKKSMQRYEFKSNYIQSLWLLGSIQEQLKNNRKAVQIYKRCCHCYKEIEAHEFRFCMMFNMARLLNQSNTMRLIIKVYKNSDYDNSVETYGDMTKESTLNNMYKELFELYIGNSDLKSAINLVHNIDNIGLKNELKHLLRNKMLIA